MLFAYVDETSNPVHYRTLALVLEEAHVNELSATLDGVMAQAAQAYAGVARDFELHGHALFHALDDWRVLKEQTRARVAIYRDALQATAEHAAAIYVEGLDRRGFQDRYAEEHDERQTCLLHLLEKVDSYARRRRQNVVVVADEHHTSGVTQRVVRALRQHEPIWGYRGRPGRLIDTVYFVPSAMSRPIQAVDLIGFLHQRVRDQVESDSRAAHANQLLWNLLAGVTMRERMWQP